MMMGCLLENTQACNDVTRTTPTPPGVQQEHRGAGVRCCNAPCLITYAAVICCKKSKSLTEKSTSRDITYGVTDRGSRLCL